MPTQAPAQVQEQHNRLLVLALKLEGPHTQHVLASQRSRSQVVLLGVVRQEKVRIAFLPLARCDFVLVLVHKLELVHLVLQQDRFLQLLGLVLSDRRGRVEGLIWLFCAKDRGLQLADRETTKASDGWVEFGVDKGSCGGRGGHEGEALDPVGEPR